MSIVGPLGSTALNADTPRKVAYFYDDDIGYYAYPVGHPMKPHRIRLAHNLIMHYNLYRHMEVYVSAVLCALVRRPCAPSTRVANRL